MAESASYRRGVALFDYSAIESDELSFRRGATIVIFGSPEEGWFEGELDGRVGMCPANYLRLDVSSPSEQIVQRTQHSSNIAVNSHEPALATPAPIQNPLALQDSSASMCVLSQDNDSKRVFERLYETGVVQVKKRQEEQEEKRIKENEEIRACNFKAGARSANIAAGRKSDKSNYGEFLYNEGIKSSHVKAEQARQVQNQKRGEENGSFQPQINEVSKKLRRDMPVVERLLMLEQVKQEKIERLKKTKEQEETQDLLFTPRILAYPLKEGRQRVWPLKGQAGQQQQQQPQGQQHFDTRDWHQEKMARLKDLRDKLDEERGATHTPHIDEHSRLLVAAATSSLSAGSDEGRRGVFSKLHREAERRAQRHAALTLESQLRILDLASRPPAKSPRAPRTPHASDGPGRFSLHDEAELRRVRKRFLEEQAAAGEDAARNAPKMDLRSELLSRERLRRDCRHILDAWEVVDKEGQVHYDGFFRAVDRLVDFAVVSEDLDGLSTEEKEVLCDRIWVCISDSSDGEAAGPDGRPGIHDPIPVNTFLDAVIHVQYGESVMMEETEPKEIGKAALGVFEEFVRILAWTKLSSHPTHATILKAENLGKRLQNLKHDAQTEFAKLLRKCGLNFNDQERDVLFNSFDLDNHRSLDFSKFTKEVRCILSPRKKAIVRTLKSFESSNVGAISISDLIRRAELQNPSRGAGSKIEETLNLICEVQKRLDDTGSKGGEPQERHLLSPHGAGSHGTRSRARVGSQEVSSPESLSASDTYQEKPADINDVPPHRTGRRQQTKNLDLGDEIPRHVYLHQLSRKWLEHRFVARQLQDEKEMEHCTFRPQINASEAKKTREESICDRLYELARCKDTGSSEKSWEEREMKECTFRPAINKRRPVSAPVQSSESASEQKHVQRVRQKLLDQKILSQTAESDNTPSSAGPSVSQRQKPKASKDQYVTSGIPIVLIEINLHDGKVARIPIFKGDDPIVLAKTFCRTHGLGSSSEAKLAQMFADQIAGVEESSLYAAS